MGTTGYEIGARDLAYLIAHRREEVDQIVWKAGFSMGAGDDPLFTARDGRTYDVQQLVDEVNGQMAARVGSVFGSTAFQLYQSYMDLSHQGY